MEITLDSIEYLKGYRDGLQKANLLTTVLLSLAKMNDTQLEYAVAHTTEEINTLSEQSKEPPSDQCQCQLSSSSQKEV